MFFNKSSNNLPYEKIGKEVRCIADEIPFEIPESWEWVCLEQVCIYIQRGKSPKYSPIKKCPVVAQKCNQWTGFFIDKAQFIAPETIASYSEERFLQDRDLLWNSTGLGTLGRMAVYKEALNPFGIAVADSHVTVIRSSSQILPEFLFYYFANPTVQMVIEEQASGTTKQKELAQNTVKTYLTPLPPLAEQKRIVAKIEELLPHIEEYGKAESKVSKLNAEFPEQLKKSILQWAIQGKLVPQNPEDEPASVLLERIRDEKAKLIKEGKIKKDKNESVIFRRDNSHYTMQGKKEVCIDEKLPFDLPDGWEWCNLQMVTENIHYGYTASAAVAGNSKLLRITDIQNNAVSWEDVPFCTVTPNELEGYQLHNRDIMIARTGGTIGKTYIVRNLAETAVFASYLIRAIPVSQINEEYLKIFMESPFYWKQLKDFSSGTGQPNVNGNSLKNLLLPLPPPEEQKRIVDFYFDFLPTIETLTDFSL